MDNNNNDTKTLARKAMIVLSRTMLAYQAPEVREAYEDEMENNSPVNWPPETFYYLRNADANFWNKYLPPQPFQNQ